MISYSFFFSSIEAFSGNGWEKFTREILQLAIMFTARNYKFLQYDKNRELKKIGKIREKSEKKTGKYHLTTEAARALDTAWLSPKWKISPFLLGMRPRWTHAKIIFLCQRGKMFWEFFVVTYQGANAAEKWAIKYNLWLQKVNTGVETCKSRPQGMKLKTEFHLAYISKSAKLPS